MAAAAEARAAWQRAANRCLVQEDRKRAPKLACCPSSSEQQHGTSNGNCTNSEDRPISNFTPLSWNHMNSNLPPDIRWWLQLQPTFGVQKEHASEELSFLGREIGESEAEDSASNFKNEEPSLRETSDTNPEKSEDVTEPPWLVSTTFKCFDSPASKNPQKSAFDTDATWIKGEKAPPWWQIIDDDVLAALVAERAMQQIENCDLPRPAKTVFFHGTESCKHENIGQFFGSSSPSRTSHPYPGRCEHSCCSYSTASTDEFDLCDVGVFQQHESNNTYRGAPDFCGSSYAESGMKQTYHTLERAELLEALRHSQTRAREAEVAAKKAYKEKDDSIKILLRQAFHLFACKQWLRILQLENICLQLKHKEHQIATMMPELPWMMPKRNPMTGQERKDWTRRKGRSQKKKGSGFFDAILFAVGLGLAGAGLLLGWTLGWLLPKL